MSSISLQPGSEYTRDMLAWLRGREAGGARCRRQSPQLARRRHLVDWTCEVQAKLKLTEATLHLAVRLLDLFMDGHDIQEPQLYLVCLGALLLASKMEERDGTIPRFTQLNLFVKNFFPLSDFLNLEFVMLGYFHWNLCLPTACCTAELLAPHAVLATDLHNGGPIIHQEKAAAYLGEYISFFLRIAVTDPNFIDTSSSLLGAAVVAAARRAFGLGPAWPELLQVLSGYSELELVSHSALLLAHHGYQPPQIYSANVACDEGYHSMNSSPVSY